MDDEHAAVEDPVDDPIDAPVDIVVDDAVAVTPAVIRRAPMALMTWAFVLLVLLIVVVLLVLKVTQGSTTVAPPPVAPAPPAVVQAATSVSASAFDAVGAPEASAPGPTMLSGQPALTVGGLPAVLYAGAEFCPYCAAERWVLVVALGRFGTFSHLGATSSSSDEVFPHTATFSFDGASYRSHYISLSAVEEYGDTPSRTAPAGFVRLHTLTTLQQSAMRRYDAAAFTSEAGALPFVDVGNRMLVVGAAIGFSPGVLQQSSMSQIASSLATPANALAQAILGQANELSAVICSLTGQRPASVCESRGVLAGGRALGI